MDFRWKLILCNIVFLLSILGLSECLKLHLYQYKYFTGIRRDYYLKAKDETICYNFPDGESADIGSVRTDKCVILYVDKNCTTPKSVVPIGRSGPTEWSHRFDKDTAAIPSYRNRDPFPYLSFHACNQVFGGGPQLDLDIYDRRQPGNSLIKRYRGVCNCRNIPASISTNPNIYVDMYGNKVEMFSKENCEGTSYQLGPHDDLDNRFLQDTIRFSPKSFRPVDLDNCYRLHADIYKFHFRNGTDEMGKDAPEITLDYLAESFVEYNFKSVADVKTSFLSSYVTDVVHFTIPGPITKLQSATVNPAGFEVTAETKFQMMTNGNITAELGEFYKWSRIDGSKDSYATIVSTRERLVSASYPIEVPPCSFCTITPDVEIGKNFPISYDLYAYVRGSDPAEELTAAEIRQNLPAGMTYIRDHDEHTVEVKTIGKMYGELAFDMVITKRCGPTPYCGVEDYKPAMPTKYLYRIPISDNQ